MVFKRAPERSILAPVQKLAVWLGIAFVVLRFIDLAFRGRLEYAGRFDLFGIMFWIETLLWILPLAMITASPKPTMANLFRGAIVIAVAGALYRFDTYLVAFNPGPGWQYFPSVPEIFISVGIISFEIALYVFLVKRFPILGGISYAK
jgi:Ni/Fe-hydrogenase subunit HybB-like protein